MYTNKSSALLMLIMVYLLDGSGPVFVVVAILVVFFCGFSIKNGNFSWLLPLSGYFFHV